MGQQVVQLTNGMNGKPFIRYRNCMRNHAASMGGHSVDGCEEFMPGGEEGTREARRCAACGCHRNFHKKELPEGFADQNFQHPQPFLPMLPYNAMVPNPKFRWDKMGDGFASLPTFSVSQPSPFYYQRLFGAVKQTDEEKSDPWLETAERGEVESIMNKRFKAEVMQEQKNKMMEFAERLGRRLHKHDEVAVGRFCDEVGVERDVLEEWMHNKSELHQKENALPVPPSRVN